MQDRQHRHDHVDTAVHVDADGLLVAHAAPDQPGGQAPDFVVQLCVGQLPLALDQCDALRRALDVFAVQMRNRVARPYAGGAAQRQQAFLFSWRKHVQPGHGHRRAPPDVA
ncbi:hypothetical protein D3C72_1759420 [compost metagenome]